MDGPRTQCPLCGGVENCAPNCPSTQEILPEPDLPWGFGHNGWEPLPELGWYIIQIASIRNRKMHRAVIKVHRAWHQDKINQQIAIALGQLVAELNYRPTAPSEKAGAQLIVPGM